MHEWWTIFYSDTCSLLWCTLIYCTSTLSLLWCTVIYCSGTCSLLWCTVIYCSGTCSLLWCTVIYCSLSGTCSIPISPSETDLAPAERPYRVWQPLWSLWYQQERRVWSPLDAGLSTVLYSVLYLTMLVLSPVKTPHSFWICQKQSQSCWAGHALRPYAFRMQKKAFITSLEHITVDHMASQVEMSNYDLI